MAKKQKQKAKHVNDDHIRTQEELENQLSGLKTIYSVFQDLNIQMFLSAGTMLGATREGNFIPWDWNTSVVCKAEEFNPKLDLFLQKMSENGFDNHLIKHGEYIRINAYKYNCTFIIENLILIGEWRTRRKYKSPDKYLQNVDYRPIAGVLFPVPSPAEECCQWQYGSNWKTPLKVKHRNEVINSEHKITAKDNINTGVFQ